MAAVRSTNNKAEVALRRELWRRGLRYRLYAPDLIGRPDIVFRHAQVVVFVDGDFWHGRELIENGLATFRETIRGKRRKWWINKIRRTVLRDLLVSRQLRTDGWLVVRIWESTIRQRTESSATRVETIVRRRAALHDN